MKLFRMSFVIAFLLLFYQSNVIADPALLMPVARIVWVEGQITALMPNQEQRHLKKMSVVYLQDQLSTDAYSRAEIAFTDNSLVTLAPNSTIKINQYVFKPAEKTKGKFVMDLIVGGFRTITGLIAKHNSNNYQVNTPVATIGVRGTDYAVFIKNQGVVMGYYHGQPCIRNAKGSICLNAHAQYVSVPSLDQPPVTLSYEPDVFLKKLPIVPALIEPFGGGAASNNSFCIS